MTYFWTHYLTGFTAVYCWLIAGIFMAFSDFVMKSLKASPPASAIAAMQSINILVFRSIFMLGLYSVAGISLYFIANGFLTGWSTAAIVMALAGVIYWITVMVISFTANIPLNDKLAVLDPDLPESHKFWQHYVVRWTKWNHLRALGSASVAAILTFQTFSMAWQV